MEVIDAFWDTRNLGVRCAELTFSLDDAPPSPDELREAVSGYAYLAAKVPSGNGAVLAALQREGFSFAECSIGFRHDLKVIGDGGRTLPREGMSHRAASEEADRAYILKRVGEGLFCTDRIYLDPAFSHELAAKRYVGWLSDELERGSLLYDVLLDGQKTGFFSYKEVEPGVSYPFLIGLYPEWRGRGLAADLVAQSLILSKKRGCRLSTTVVSSNNIAIVKAQEAAGSRIHRLQYVLTKHREA